MQKNYYQKELSPLSGAQKKDGTSVNKSDIKRIQSWLTLFSISNPRAGTGTAIDGVFGAATEQAIKNFQKAKGISQTGVADQKTFNLLCEPMKKAFTDAVTGAGIRQLIVNFAFSHLANNPYELTIEGAHNSGPWVRAYMDGHEGEDWFWCAGFVQTIIDQAFSAQGKNFKTIMPLTYSCDTLALSADGKGALLRNKQVCNDPSKVKPGDIFLIQKAPTDWIHMGLIINVGADFFETIEGNTNSDGSRNGIAVYKRVRNFRKSKLDVILLEELI